MNSGVVRVDQIIFKLLTLNKHHFPFLLLGFVLHEFAKLRAMCAMQAIVAYVPTCHSADVPKAGQYLIFTCQRTNKRANVPMCQRYVNFSSLCAPCAKRRAIFLSSSTKRRANKAYIMHIRILLEKHTSCKLITNLF